MTFIVGEIGEIIDDKAHFLLIHNNWNDWWRYENLYTLEYVRDDGSAINIGAVKIGQIDSEDIPKVPDIPCRFEALDKERFISLGQDEEYYDNLNSLGVTIRQEVLSGLNDIALELDVYERYKRYSVVRESLTRYIPSRMIKNQLHRMAFLGARQTSYHFEYAYSTSELAPSLSFSVEPGTFPPTNIHVIIGRNGVGKSWLLRDMIYASSDAPEKTGNIVFEGNENEFSNIVCLAFSAFDEFTPINSDNPEALRCTYIGIKSEVDGKKLSINQQFSHSLTTCMETKSRYMRWKRTMAALDSDPIFSSADLVTTVDIIQNNRSKYTRDKAEKELQQKFEKLSSGHKIVALTVTRLVETVEECTLVLLDEPELHLHPPLLAAFMRALSDLLIDRNGVAIVATHSPVVLQEVPRSCAWIIRRSGREIAVDRPQIETFGENVGVLTSEVFGLEVSKSGFRQMIKAALTECAGDYEMALAKFHGQLGAEALGILSVMAHQMGDEEK